MESKTHQLFPDEKSIVSIWRSYGTTSGAIPFYIHNVFVSTFQCLPLDLALARSEEHTSELQSQSISYAVFCLKKKKKIANFSREKTIRIIKLASVGSLGFV